MIKRRDLTIINFGGMHMVVSCDSCGAIGQKPCDVVRAEPFTVGAFTARVAIAENLSAGATIVAVANNICNEMNDTGIEIIRGIKHEMALAGIDPGLLTGSTEENFRTDMTALGVTVVGLCASGGLAFTQAEKGDVFVLFGMPLLGPEVLDRGGEAVGYDTIQFLSSHAKVRELSPVGSKGIAHECDTLAGLHNGSFFAYPASIDLKKSGGPATCVVALASPGFARTAPVILGELR